jgi:methylated-DNA-protein-cysteine methyltransferase related protein
VSDFAERVREVVAALAPGDVASYGEVAEEAGAPGAARAVGNVLARSDGLPWWRVVRADGRLAPGLEELQAELLSREGVGVQDGVVVPSGSRARRRHDTPRGQRLRPYGRAT